MASCYGHAILLFPKARRKKKPRKFLKRRHREPTVTAGLVWIQQQAADALLAYTVKAGWAIDKHVTAPLNYNQFAALVSFTFNVGIANFESSMVLKLLTTDGTNRFRIS